MVGSNIDRNQSIASAGDYNIAPSREVEKFTDSEIEQNEAEALKNDFDKLSVTEDTVTKKQMIFSR